MNLDGYLNHAVVLDLDGGYLAIGTLTACAGGCATLADADLHNHAEANCSQDVYIIDSVRLGVRANRKRVAVPLARIIAVSRLDEVLL